MVTAEPDVESLLALIRNAINVDMGLAEPDSPPLPAPAKNASSTMRELRMKFDTQFAKLKTPDSEISELRSKIDRNRKSTGPSTQIGSFESRPLLRQPRRGFEAIMAGDMKHDIAPPKLHPRVAELRPSFQETEAPAGTFEEYVPEPEYAVEDTSQQWVEEERQQLPVVQYQALENAYEPPSLMSDISAMAAHDSFSELAQSLAGPAPGEQSVEDMTQNLLRGMLKTWLDDNLPGMVEKLVREEIERVARRGR